jgi:2-dehydro-3-deoxygluconokinase
LREIETASLHHFSAVCFRKGEIFKARDFAGLNVLDRVGSGDAFAAGFIYSLLAEKAIDYAVDCGTAHGALSMTTPGDNSMATLREVESLMQGETAVVKR